MVARFVRTVLNVNVPLCLRFRFGSPSAFRSYSSTQSFLKMSPEAEKYRTLGERRDDIKSPERLNRRISALKVDLHPKKDHSKRSKPAKQSYTKPAPKPLQGPFSVFIACLPGLEPLLLEEVTYLLATSEKSERNKAKAIPGGVEAVLPSLAHLYVLHLYLGTASHIYLRLNGGSRCAGLPPLFSARGFAELQRKIKELMVTQRWEQLFDVPRLKEDCLSRQLQVHVTTSKSKLMHTKAVEERVRETIGELLGVKGLNSNNQAGVDVTANGGSKGIEGRPVVRLLVRIDRDEVQLSLDTSSASSSIPLHMRGYRLRPHKAPLREDLTFALLMAGGLKPRWNLQPLQSWLTKSDAEINGALDEDDKNGAGELTLQLFDPLCGSGTIAIEGASILAGLPPGRFRPPPFEGTKLYDDELWDDIKSHALSVSANNDGNMKKVIMVSANDISKEAISAAISNAKRAGVDRIIDFTVGSFKTHPLSKHLRQQSTRQISDSRYLLVVTNPPYGKRLETDKSNSSIYKQIANSIRSLPCRIRCTMIGKDPRSLRESSLPFNVAFSTKQGGLSVVAMSTGTIDNSPRINVE